MSPQVTPKRSLTPHSMASLMSELGEEARRERERVAAERRAEVAARDATRRQSEEDLRRTYRRQVDAEARRLQAARAVDGVAEAPPNAGAAPSGRPSPRRAWLVGAALLAVVAAGAGGLALWAGPGASAPPPRAVERPARVVAAAAPPAPPLQRIELELEIIPPPPAPVAAPAAAPPPRATPKPRPKRPRPAMPPVDLRVFGGRP